MKILIEFIIHYSFLTYWFFIRRRLLNYRNTNIKPRLFWGTTSIISNKYWSNSLIDAGFVSKTVMKEYYAINNKDDFDLYSEDIFNPWRFRFRSITSFLKILQPYFLLDYAMKNFDIFHVTFEGIFLSNTKFWNKEIDIIKSMGGKIVAMPYGGDAYMYSRIKSPSLQHALIISYPKAAVNETEISKRVTHIQKKADIIITGVLLDGMSRWDILPFSMVTIDSNQWGVEKKYNYYNGYNGIVKIIHTPNHRGFKGTEFIIKAVNELQQEGLQIELILIEGRPNAEVKQLMQTEADILAEQLIFVGYALSGIEGMASGLPVLSNLEEEEYTRVFRRYSYLNECPILSTSPETVKNNLRILVQNPDLREKLGIAGRAYVEKYHSYKTAQYMFGKIYDKIWYGKKVDLMNMFNPLNADSYNNQKPLIKHPLQENKLRV